MKDAHLFINLSTHSQLSASRTLHIILSIGYSIENTKVDKKFLTCFCIVSSTYMHALMDRG